MKKNCIDCNKKFTPKDPQQVRGTLCQRRHTKGKKTPLSFSNEEEQGFPIFKKISDAENSFIKMFVSSNSLEELGQAMVNLQHRKYITERAGREIKQEKDDTREYNNYFISKEDTQALDLMDGGVRDDILPGESMALQAKDEIATKGDEWLFKKLKEAMEKKDYVSFPFCKEVSSDIRTKYLLRTDQLDSFSNIVSEIKLNRGEIVSEDDLSTLLEALKESESRLKKEEILFVNPLEEGTMGELISLSADECKRYNLAEGAKFDKRTDSHDLVSLKELAFVMSGGKVDHLSPFAGSFSKCLPELNSKGIRGIVFFVKDDKLVKIKISRYSNTKQIPFGPVEAAASIVDVMNENADIKLTENTRIYSCVTGAVAAPNSTVYSYIENLPVNKNIVPAAETFLFHLSETKVPLATRIYFYPNKPSLLHPLYQNMSVTYGTSDQMFNSCANDPDGYFHSEDVSEDMGLYIRSFGVDAEPSVLAAKKHFMPDDVPPAAMTHWDEYKKIGKEVSDSLYSENSFTNEKYLSAMEEDKESASIAKKIKSLKLLDNSLPLTSRFVVFNYVTNSNGGVTKEAQLTTFRRIPRFEFGSIMEDFKMGMRILGGLRKAKASVIKGKDAADAYFENIDEETRDYMKRNDKK